jgi:hypothetical protein
MDRFYENLLTHGLDRDLALRDAQRATRDATVGELRAEWLSETMIERLAAGDAGARRGLDELTRQRDGHRPFAHPFYWGAFICQGDTAPLTESTLPLEPDSVVAGGLGNAQLGSARTIGAKGARGGSARCRGKAGVSFGVRLRGRGLSRCP